MLRLDRLTDILLYGAAILGYLPLAPYLQPLTTVALPAAIVFAVIGGSRGWQLKDRPALIVSLGCFLFYALQFSRHNVAAPAANLLAMLLAIRLAGDKSPRNVLQSILLALFCLAASTLFDLSPGFLFYLALLVLILAASLVLLTFRSTQPAFRPTTRELRAIVGVALLQPLVALPLIVLLFFILPRTQFPLWQGISMVGNDRTGISDTVQPGDKNSVTDSKVTVFRAEMPPLPADDLYWRVTVLNGIEGDRWIQRPAPPETQRPLRGGRDLRYTIFLEPGRYRHLPALNFPQSIYGARGGPSQERLLPAYALTGGRRSYEVVSRTGGAAIPAERIDRSFYTRLPETVPPRLLELSRAVALREKSDVRRLQLLQEAFIELKLAYASQDLPTGADAMERFLFREKRGHCELFATAFATALRAAGVPARLVGGYAGGTYNELAGYYAVTEDRAHLWVEAWVEGSGWVTVDPSRFAGNYSAAERASGSPLANRVRILADTLNFYWNRAVITYDLESQLAAMSRAGEQLRDLKAGKLPLTTLSGIGLCLLLATGISLALRRRRSPEERLLRAFRRALLQRHGVTVPAACGLHEATAAIVDPAVQEFVTLYTGAVYRDRRLTGDELGRLKALLVQIGR